MEKDELILRKLGYRQVLQRTWGSFTAVSMAVSALSVLTSISGVWTTTTACVRLAEELLKG